MKKWLDEEYEFEIEVTGYLRGDKPEHYCRNGEEPGDRYTCTYGCPVNSQGQGICPKLMMVMFPVMEAVRSGGDLRNLGGEDRYTKTIVCPDREAHGETELLPGKYVWLRRSYERYTAF